MRGALENVPGIGHIVIEVGDPDFTVEYDSTKIEPDAMVKLLVQKGEADAKVKL